MAAGPSAACTAAPVVSEDGHAFAAQADIERRRWLCATTSGGVKRLPSCAPAGWWTRTDASAGRDPGLQQAYGSGAFRSPSAHVVPLAHSDHDVLLVRARLER